MESTEFTAIVARVVPSEEQGSSRAGWLLFVPELPDEPASLRVRIGRRLRSMGAVALEDSLHVLPKTILTAEDFQWVRREIVAFGGNATVVETAAVDGLSDRELESKFRAARDADYAVVAEDTRRLIAQGAPPGDSSDEEAHALLAAVARLEQRVEEIAESDFFGASGREVATRLLRELRARSELAAPRRRPAAGPLVVRARTWVTRTGVHVDRIASAWLIRNYIDPEASFKFVPHKGYVPLEGELRFDMFEAEFSHEGDDCTFETLVRRFDLAVPGLRAVADIVHDIDLKESKFGRPETAGTSACVNGICHETRDDDGRIARGAVLFDALLAYFATKKEARS